MVKRRTLGEGLSPEEEAFLNPSRETPQTLMKEEVKPAEPALEKRIEAAAEVPPQPVTQPSVTFTLQPPLPGMVGLTTRIPAEISAALMAASMQRRIQRRSPFTQQEIVTEALTEWLKSNAFIPPQNA